jgi:hypothetical protein
MNRSCCKKLKIYLNLCNIAKSYFGLNRVRVPVINQKLIFLQQFGYILDLFLNIALYRPGSSLSITHKSVTY